MARSYKPKSHAEIRRNMGAIRSTENRTEVKLRKALFALGLRYRKYVPGLLGKPDIVFPRERIAVFIDGDYWHGRMLREQGRERAQAYFTTEQQTYWMPKLLARLVRDDFVSNSLRYQGWIVLRFWESDVRQDIDGVRDLIAREVRNRRSTR
jgi:DNA mismatch endonuclease, patch repair protein